MSTGVLTQVLSVLKAPGSISGGRGLVMAPPTLVWAFLPVLLLGLGRSQASLLKVNKGLKVQRGQTAFLQEGDLQFHVPPQKDVCKLEVVENEPISQRVGRLLPQVRDPPGLDLVLEIY